MTSALPLDGITVVEIGHSVAAPFGALILAELGADVIKIENPEKGDHARDWGPPYSGDTAVMFGSLNRNKKSAAINLKDQHECDCLRGFILDHADVVIQNLRPGAVEKLNLGALDLTGKKESLIYCNLSAFGKVGPLQMRPGYDPLMQAYGGLMSITGEPGRPPVRAGTSPIDMGAGMWAAIGILAALIERSKTGRGGIVDTSLYETALAWMTTPLAMYLASGQVPVRHGSAAPQIVPYQIFETADNYLMVAAGNDGLFRQLAHVLDHPEWADDPRFAKNRDRVANRETLLGLITPLFRQKDNAAWMALLDEARVPNAPLQSTDAVASNEQTKALGIIQSHPAVEFGTVGLPISFNGVRPPYREASPRLGSSNDLILGDGKTS